MTSRTWVNNTTPAINATDLNGIEADLDKALGNTVKTVTAGYTITTSDRVIICNASSQIAIILPDPALVSTNRVYTVRNITTNRVLMGSLGTSPKIDGTSVNSTASANVFLMYNCSASFVSDGTNWWSFGTGPMLVANNNQPNIDSSFNFNLSGFQVDSNGNIVNLGNVFNLILGATSGQPTDGKNFGLKLGNSTDSPLGRLWYKAWGGLNTWGWAPVTAGRTYATKTANYTLTATDEFVVFNGTSLTATLPDPTGNAMNGRVFSVKNINASALSVVSAGTSKTIDGQSTLTLQQWQGFDLISDGTQWLIRNDRALTPSNAAVRASTTSNGTGGSPSATIPATAQVGDLLLFFVGSNYPVNYPTVAAPTGWTMLSYTSTNYHNSAVFGKTCATGDAGATVTTSLTSSAEGWDTACLAVSGANNYYGAATTQIANGGSTVTSLNTGWVTSAPSTAFDIVFGSARATASGMTIATSRGTLVTSRTTDTNNSSAVWTTPHSGAGMFGPDATLTPSPASVGISSAVVSIS